MKKIFVLLFTFLTLCVSYVSGSVESFAVNIVALPMISAIMIYGPAVLQNSTMLSNGYFPLSALEAEAMRNLSSFAGNSSQSPYTGDDFEGYEGYDGFNDPFIDGFGGVDGGIHNIFTSEIADGRIFTMMISNNVGSDETIMLCYGSEKTNAVLGNGAGISTDGCIRTQNGFASVAGTAQAFNAKSMENNFTIEQLIAFVHKNPTRIIGLRVESDSNDQLKRSLLLRKKSPFRDLQTDHVRLAVHTDENTVRDGIVTVRMDYQLDDQTEVLLEIPAKSTTYVSFIFGAIHNEAKALAVKNKVAQVNKGRNFLASASGGIRKALPSGNLQHLPIR